MVKDYHDPPPPKKEIMEPTSVIRCKLRVSEVLLSKNTAGQIDQERVKLVAVYGAEGSENAEWSKWTPQANFEIYINNPAAFGKLSSGGEFYVDFIPAAKGD